MERLAAEAASYAATQGILMRRGPSAGASSGTVVHAPLTLRPSPVDRACLARARALARPLGALVAAVADDRAYLRQALAGTARADPDFTGRLLALLPEEEEEEEEEEGEEEEEEDGAGRRRRGAPLLHGEPAPRGRGVELAVLRHDFFVHQPALDDAQPVLRMVEMNCIAASFGCLSSKVCKMHRFFFASGHPAGVGNLRLDAEDGTANRNGVSALEAPVGVRTALPENDPMRDLAAGIAAAHEAFCDLRFDGGADRTPMPVRVVMVVHEGDTNSFDQDLLRFAIWENHGVDVVRLTLAQIHAHGALSKDGDGSLHIAATPGVPPFVASVVYFRAGYSPDDYPTEKEWLARKLIDSSTAASCPSVAVQLVGTKKIQQILDNPGEVERFVKDADEVALIRSCFARQYSLAPGPEGDAAAKLGLDDPEGYVLKPQREGGGNNLYSEKLRAALQRMLPSERAGYILMERLHPVIVRNTILRDGKLQDANIVSELGVFGVHIKVNGKEIANIDAGTLLRSKLASENDGGVAAGVAVLDSALPV